MRPDGSDKQLISGASELFSPGKVPLKSSYGAPSLVIGRTEVLSDVGHEDLQRMEGGCLVLDEEVEGQNKANTVRFPSHVTVINRDDL